MKRKHWPVLWMLLFAVFVTAVWADIYGPYRGFGKMLERAGAVIVARTPPSPPMDVLMRNYDPSNGTRSWTTQPREVEVLRTIKGDIPEHTKLLVAIGFYPVGLIEVYGEPSFPKDPRHLTPIQALDTYILKHAEKKELSIPPGYDTDYLLFLDPNTLNPQEPECWTSPNFPGPVIVLKPGVFDAVRKAREQSAAAAKKNPPPQKEDKAHQIRQEIIQLILANLDKDDQVLRNKIEALLNW